MIRTLTIIFSIIIILLVILTASVFYSPRVLTFLYNSLIISEQPQPSDAIIVLSGSSERDIYAADLHKLGFSRVIIMSGRNASESMTERAVKKGVKREDIILELKAVTTYQNATYTCDIMLDKGFQSAIVVSSPYHMKRSKLVFERVYKNTGISLTYCAVPPSLSTETQRAPAVFRWSVIEEYVKLIYYWFRYW